MHLDAFRLQLRECGSCTECGSSAAHIELHHLDHRACPSLQVVAAGIKGQALADNANFALHLAFRCVCQVDELRGQVGSAAHSQEGTHTHLLTLRLIQDLRLQTDTRREILCRGRQVRWRDNVWSPIDQLPGKDHPAGHSLSLLCGGGTARGESPQELQRRRSGGSFFLLRRLRAPEALVRVKAHVHPLDELLHLHAVDASQAGRVAALQPFQGPSRRHSGESPIRVLVRRPQPHEHHPLQVFPVHLQGRGRTRLAVELLSIHERPQSPTEGLVDRITNSAQLQRCRLLLVSSLATDEQH
mmetsp:Transcript_148112/g.369257  ORF Transcript_148112/g.369257 Transcript_148112/m.369257 type:complete len:300 (-) Transcript_148112:184-1083(-)